MNRPFTKVGDHFTCVASDGFPRPVPVACFPAPFTCVWFLALSGRLALACFPALSSCHMFPALKKRKNFHPRVLQFTSFQDLNVSLFSLFTYFTRRAYFFVLTILDSQHFAVRSSFSNEHIHRPIMLTRVAYFRPQSSVFIAVVTPVECTIFAVGSL